MTEILKDNIIELRDIIIRERIGVKFNIYNSEKGLQDIKQMVISKHNEALHDLETIFNESLKDATKVIMGDV